MLSTVCYQKKVFDFNELFSLWISWGVLLRVWSVCYNLRCKIFCQNPGGKVPHCLHAPVFGFELMITLRTHTFQRRITFWSCARMCLVGHKQSKHCGNLCILEPVLIVSSGKLNRIVTVSTHIQSTQHSGHVLYGSNGSCPQHFDCAVGLRFWKLVVVYGLHCGRWWHSDQVF